MHSEEPGNESPTTWRSLLVSLGPAGLLGIAWTIFPAVLGIMLLVRLGDATVWIDGLGTWGFIVYILIFMVTSGFGVLPTYAQAVLGGWIFGMPLGLLGALAGFTGGSLIGYVISRLVSRDRIDRIIEQHKKASVVRDALIGRGFWSTTGIVTLLRIPPNSPFALTNLVMSSCKVALPPYIIGVVIGMTPRTALFVGSAAAAAESGAVDIQTFVTEGKGGLIFVVGLILLVVALGIVSWVADRALKRLGIDMT